MSLDDTGFGELSLSAGMIMFNVFPKAVQELDS